MVADIKRLKELLDQGKVKSALFVLPQNPSQDLVAAALSLEKVLDEARGIASTVASPTPMSVEHNRLVGVQNVREDLGDKNLNISFIDYPADDVERVAYNIENGQFTLSVIPKPGKVGPREDQVKLTYAGTAADLVIAVGANYPQDLGQFAQNLDLTHEPQVALLGNAPISGWNGAIELIDPSASSVSEVVLEIAKELGAKPDQDSATNLYLGLEDGTQNFTSPRVNHQTFEAAAELLLAGAQRRPAQPQGQLPQMPGQRSQQVPSDYPPMPRDGGNLG